jgi:hypothetical protein
MKNLIGKSVVLKDWKGRRSSSWGIVTAFDGETYWIAYLGYDDYVLPYYRCEFIVPRI